MRIYVLDSVYKKQYSLAPNLYHFKQGITHNFEDLKYSLYMKTAQKIYKVLPSVTVMCTRVLSKHITVNPETLFMPVVFFEDLLIERRLSLNLS